MAVDKIDPLNDARVQHCTTNINGVKYRVTHLKLCSTLYSSLAVDYLHASPDGQPKATIFLIHGWPDISIGWRYQIPTLLKLGYRVVCPDLMGFGGTDAPEAISFYGFKRAASDIKELAQQLGVSQIILGGHDWGGAVVYRTALWFPDLVTHLFSVCTPYFPPSSDWMSLEDVVETTIPNFRYQLQLGSGEVEKHIVSKEQIKHFLNGAYGGRGKNGEVGFDPGRGLLFENLPKLGPTRLLNDEELEYYTTQYANHGVHSTLNWYRTRKINYDEELLLTRHTIEIPTLFISATRDTALPPAMSKGMEKYFPQLTRKEVESSHWALWEKPVEVNGIIEGWLKSVTEGGENVVGGGEGRKSVL